MVCHCIQEIFPLSVFQKSFSAGPQESPSSKSKGRLHLVALSCQELRRFIANIAEVARIFEIFGALLIFVVHSDFFIWAIQTVSFICYMVATCWKRAPRACPQGSKKDWKNKTLSKLQEILGFLDSLRSYLKARTKTGEMSFLCVLKVILEFFSIAVWCQFLQIGS